MTTTGFTRIVLLLPLACLTALGPSRTVAEDSIAAKDGAVEITTDTPEYCAQLYDRVEAMRLAATTPPPQEVADLSAAGQRMCADGLARGGVLRLRRALAIMTRSGKGD